MNILDHVYAHEARNPQRVYLTQPVGNGQVVDYTWAEVIDQACRMAGHLQAQGLGKGSQVAILSKNCTHFFIAELAIWMAGCTTVAIFPTEGPDTIGYVLEHSESRLLFVGKLDAWETQKAGVPAGLPCIALPLAPNTGYESWDAVIARATPIAKGAQRAPDDLAMIVYTSGSTGQPKGVMHCFSHISAAAEGIAKGINWGRDDRVISYLPLAHVVERAYIMCGSMVGGGHVFFAEALDTFVADVKRARPTLFVSVPRLWLKFQQGVLAKMPARKLNLLLSIPIVGKLVARKVLTGLGLEEAKLAGSGSAPISADLIAWYRRLGLNLLEGYGMTEDFAYSHFSRPGLGLPGYVGMPFPEVQVRLGEGNEVQIKSPGALVGYFKQPELMRDCMTDDGYFRTGDVGERRPDGMLKITGRLKELFKTAKGKYVAPAPIENMINTSPMVELSMVSGVGQPAAYGLVVLSEEQRKHMSEPGAREAVEAELGALLKQVNEHVADYEQLRMLVVAREPWAIENGCLTPTMKIKRGKIEAGAAPKVEAWYAARGPVIWE
ncbi:MAG: AMP-binding protein [Pseudomonadota bacterium]